MCYMSTLGPKQDDQSGSIRTHNHSPHNTWWKISQNNLSRNLQLQVARGLLPFISDYALCLFSDKYSIVPTAS
jgi:hypothetical protein